VAPINLSSAAGGSSAAAAQYAPTPPWQSTAKQLSENKLVQTALSGANIVNPNAAKLDMPGAGAVYKNLFAVYQGLNTLYGVADQASGANVSSFQLSQLASAFQSGLAQVDQFVGQTNFGGLRLTTGTTTSSETSTASTPTQASEYQTAALNTTGDSAAVIPAFQGNVQFDVSVRKLSGAQLSVHMDLSDMGSTPRTMANVVAYLNGQMKAAGAVTTFSVNAMPAQPRTITVAGKPVTVSPGQPQWGLAVDTNPVESVSFSAPQTDPAVYVGQVVGIRSAPVGAQATATQPAQSQLLKFQAGGPEITPAASPPHAAPDQLFTDTLGAAVTSIQGTAAAPDGSVYVLANVSASPSGTSAPGGQDVALLKYDSAGKLLFQSDLGAASSAGGLSLAVSADGSKVAVVGQVSGPLVAGQATGNAAGANSFVAEFDAQGQQVWSAQNDALAGNQANAVAFGADGTVYVTGRTATGAGAVLTPQAASSGYLQVFSKTGVEVSTTKFGAGGVNSGAGVAVDGSTVYVAGTQNGAAVVSAYDVTNPTAPALVASRNVGDLGGGAVVGVAVANGTVYVAGSTRSGALSAGAVTSAYSGGLDAFAATLSTGLAPASSDAVAYYGGAGDDSATAMAVSNGQVFLTGSSTGPLPGQAAIGAKDGFVAELDVGTGAVDWSQRFTGQNGQVAPNSIAVAATGASVLDQLGLPEGTINAPVSNLLTATTAVKAGDSFSIGTRTGSLVKITVSANETMASLAGKISRATGSGVSVSAHTTANGVQLQIQPLDSFSTVVLAGGPAGSDALAGLGLKAGILYKTQTTKGPSVPADGKGPIYGLGLSPTLSLGTAAGISQAKAQLTAAMSVIKNAYQALKTAATPANVLALQKAQVSGQAPAYLTAQIASYQAALARLTAGQTSTTTFGA
jgi:hypothetical protein